MWKGMCVRICAFLSIYLYMCLNYICVYMYLNLGHCTDLSNYNISNALFFLINKIDSTKAPTEAIG